MNCVQRMTRYKAWADVVFLAAVSQLPPDELIAPRPIYFGSLIRTLHHAYAMDYVWQSHLHGRPHELVSRNPEHCPGHGELVTAQRQMDGWYVEYADLLCDESLGECVEFEFIGGGAGAMTREDMILHVVNHTTYHRGHVADMLYHLNIFPPTTDYPVFLRSQAAPSTSTRKSVVSKKS